MEYKRKPDWLKIRLGGYNKYAETNNIVQNNGLHTICVSGRCPNIGECWGRGTATFMIGGNICTRSCKFCNTQTGRPEALDLLEPLHVAESIAKMGLRHAVITSVDRDDLPDLGADHWVQTIRQITAMNPETTLEVLIPDFQGRDDLIDRVCDCRPNVVSHNMETVRRLTPTVRSAAKYAQSLHVLERIAANGLKAKTSIMLGLGESLDEVEELMDDVLASGCKVLSMGQYLQPTLRHLPVEEYIHPDVFDSLKTTAYNKGFAYVESGPLVRSSYHAENCI